MPCESCALMILIVNNNKKGSVMVIWEFIPVTWNFVIAIYSAWTHVRDLVLPFPRSAQCWGEFRGGGRR